MLLVSYEFLFFMLVTVCCYYLLPKKFQWIVLLAVSCLFYIFSGWKAFGFIVTTALSAWWIANRMAGIGEETKTYLKVNHLGREEKKTYKAVGKKKQFHCLIAGLILNFGLLAILKYTNFAIDNLNSLLHLFGAEQSVGYVRWLLPLGISYYTFQTMGYLIDIYRDKYEPEKSFFRFSLFVSFFPQLIQGPITQFDEMKKEFFRSHKFEQHNIYAGLQRMLWGYTKKLIVADRLAPVIMNISQDMERYRGFYVWIGMISFTIQIYADFSGGMDIVIGVAQLFGITLPENFERPYFSKTVPEYWRRWHMSLMLWLREYIFYPACVWKPVNRLTTWGKNRWGKAAAKRIPVYSASILVWLVVGIWHGATWGYVIWGMIHCAILLISQELSPFRQQFHQRFDLQKKAWFKILQITRTLLILSLVQMLEYYYSVGNMLRMQWSMLTELSLAQLDRETLLSLGIDFIDWGIVFAGVLLMLVVSMLQRSGSVRVRIGRWSGWKQFLIWYGLLVFVIIFGIYGQGYDASQFIYNQF